MSTVVVTTEAFLDLASKCAQEQRLDGARLLIAPHPIGGTPSETLENWADASIDGLIQQLGG